jgi:hypothetical protein
MVNGWGKGLPEIQGIAGQVHGHEDTDTDTDNMNTIAFPSKVANACQSLERSALHLAQEVVVAVAEVVRMGIGKVRSTHASKEYIIVNCCRTK